MTTCYLAPDPIQGTQFIPGGNVPANGGQLFFYASGSSTKQTVYKDNTGSTAWSNPIVLDSGGNLPSGGEVWFPSGQTFKVVFAPSTDTDPPSSPYWTKDNLSGMNDTSVTGSEWIAGPTPTYVSGTSFTLSGDQTGTFTQGRRIKFTVTAGTVYGTVFTSSYSVLTTVVMSMDGSQALDSGLSALSYGILAASNPSVPAISDIYPIRQADADRTKQVRFNVSTYPASSTTVSVAIPANNVTINDGLSRVLGNTSKSNASTTKYDMAASGVMLRNPSDGTVISRYALPTITADLDLPATGSTVTANGCDGQRLHPTTTNIFVHFYWIGSPTTTATIASSTGPSSGPQLPTGYTHWAYSHSVRLGGATSTLVATRCNGAWVNHDAAQQVLNTSAYPTVESGISLTSTVPAEALEVKINTFGSILAGGGAINMQLKLRAVSGLDYQVIYAKTSAGTQASPFSASCVVPNVSQQLLYIWSNVTNASSDAYEVDVLGYKVKNGGE